MTALQRTLAILACVFLAAQTVRHVYVLYVEPRDSVLDRFDEPLKDEIAAATSLDELVRRYEPVRQEVDRLKNQRRAEEKDTEPSRLAETEPYRSEASLRAAIASWEDKAKETLALRVYWTVGVLLVAAGLPIYRRFNRWLGVTLLIAGFVEIVYWTSPCMLDSTREFDRLLLNKLVLSVLSLALLAATIRVVGAFTEGAPPVTQTDAPGVPGAERIAGRTPLD